MRLWMLFALVLGGGALADGLSYRSDSGIRGPSYNDLLKDWERLERENPDIVRVVEYGKSVRGRPLRLILVMSGNRALQARPAVIMSGSTHGNEYLNIADRLPEQLLKLSRHRNGAVNQFLRTGGVFVFIPVLNPDGYEARRRFNANGIDLNRDWSVPPADFKGFKEVETRSLATYLEQLRQKLRLRFDLAVDYHCCLGTGAVIHPWGFKREFIPNEDRKMHQLLGGFANEAGLRVKVGSSGELLWYLPLGTTSDYYYSRYKTISLAYEGEQYQEHKKLAQHVRWWQLMVRGALARALRTIPRATVRMEEAPLVPVVGLF